MQKLNRKKRIKLKKDFKGNQILSHTCRSLCETENIFKSEIIHRMEKNFSRKIYLT